MHFWDAQDLRHLGVLDDRPLLDLGHLGLPVGDDTGNGNHQPVRGTLHSFKESLGSGDETGLVLRRHPFLLYDLALVGLRVPGDDDEATVGAADVCAEDMSL